MYTYNYDAVGNRLRKGVGGEVTEYVYDDANRLTSAGGVEYTWDQNGNLLDDGERTYEYDYANRLVQVVTGTFTTTFTYNGDGHRLAKGENGVTTSYVVAVLGLSQVLVETTDGSSIRYVYGHDLLAEHDGEAWAWHLNDGLGSVRQLAGASGNVTLAQGYTPFGVPLWSAGEGTTGYGFTGERWEAYSALLFLRARYYEPGTGRFISADPWEGSLMQPRTMNRYPYVLSHPTDYTDPTGFRVRKKGIPDRYQYSCRCGWIDWDHAGPGAPWELINKVKAEPSEGIPYTVIKVSMYSIPIVIDVTHEYVIDETWDDTPLAWSIALGAFKDLSEAFEAKQTSRSSFSEEDLPSNLIGFYIALYEHAGIFHNPEPRISAAEKTFVCQACGCVDPPDDIDGKNSCKVYDAYEESEAWRKVKDWNDAHLDFDDGCIIPSLCGNTKRTWPEAFSRIIPALQGRALGLFWEYDSSLDGRKGKRIQKNVWELDNDN